jgi:hypothetical protein
VGGGVTILNTSLPDGRAGTDYFGQLSQSGGSGAITWSATGLPPGIVLRSDPAGSAILAGRPQRAGVYPVVLRVQDGTGESAVRPLAIAVTASSSATASPDGGVVVTTGAILPEGSVGTAYGLTFAARGGTFPHRFTVRTPLPPGLAMNDIGQLTGTPQRPGAFQFDIVATDATGFVSPAKTFLLEVFSAIRLQVGEVPPGIERRAYSAQIRAVGGAQPYQWNATGLPSGLQVRPSATDPNAAEIFGIPDGPTPASGAQVAIAVFDRNQLGDRRTVRLIVSDSSLQVLTTSLPGGVVGQSYTQTIAISGGAPPYSCSISSSTGLPPDLRLSPTGCVISGVPRIAANQNVEIIVRDSAGTAVTTRLLLNIQAPDLRITTRDLPPATEGAAMPPFQMRAEGGTGQYLWQATGLPGGLRMSPEGVITGTPNSAGAVETINITVTDRNRRDDARVQVFAMQVRGRGSVTILTTGSIGPALLDQPFRQPIEATGGRVPYRWTLTSASPAQPVLPLPPGLVLDQDTGTLVGRPFQAGIYRFLIRAADIDGQNDVREFELPVDIPLEVSIAEQPEFLLVGDTGRVQLRASAADPSLVEFSLTNAAGGATIDARTGLITIRPAERGTIVLEAAASNGSQRTPVHVTIRVIDPLPGRLSLLPLDTIPELPRDSPRSLLPDLTAAINGGRTSQAQPTAVAVSMETSAPEPGSEPDLVAGSRQLPGSVGEGAVTWSEVPLEGTGPFGQNLLRFRNLPARLTSAEATGFRRDVGVRIDVGSQRAEASLSVVTRNGIAVSALPDGLVIQEQIKDAFRHSNRLWLAFQSTSGATDFQLTPRDPEQASITPLGTQPGIELTVLRHDPESLDRIELTLTPSSSSDPAVLLVDAGFALGPPRPVVLATSGSPNPSHIRHAARNLAGVPVAPGGLAVLQFSQPPAGVADATITSDTPLPELGGVRVQISDAQGGAHAGGLVAVSPREVLFVVPAEVATGLASFTVEPAGGADTLARTAALISPVAPGLLSADGSGGGPARGRLLRLTGESQVAIPLARFDESAGRWLHVPIEPAATGERLFLTIDTVGLRQRSDLANVFAAAGVQPLRVESAGPHLDLPLLDALVLELTPSLQGAGVLELRVAADGSESNAVTVELR